MTTQLYAQLTQNPADDAVHVHARTATPATAAAGRVGSVDVELVIPVYNEQRDLEHAVRRLHQYATDELTCSFRITVADNAAPTTPGMSRPGWLRSSLRWRLFIWLLKDAGGR